MNRWKKALRFGISISLSLCILGAGWLGLAGSAVAQALRAPDFLASEAAAPQAATPQAAALPTGESIFSANCAACHAGGGNIIRRGKNLKQRAMVRNGFETVGAIAAIVTQGKGIMPAYADRLTSAEIEAIAQYVHQKSKSGW